MSFGHWLKGATRIRFDDRTLGNLLKNGAVAAGTAVGGPLGLAIGAGGGIAGQAALGGNLGESLNAGLKGATNTGLAQAGKGVISRALSSGGAPNVAEAVGNSAAPSATPTSGLPLPSVPNLTSVAGPVPHPGLLTRALDTGKDAASWLGNHDKTASALFSGVGDVLDTSDERLRQAQASALEGQNADTEYERTQRKARDAALEPLRQALYGGLGQQISGNYGSIAKNPYATGGV